MEGMVVAIREELARHPALWADDGLGRVTLVVIFDRSPRQRLVKQVLLKGEWRHDL